MSAHANPNIITDGLVIALDAADRKSYPGTGTTWKDRSGNEIHGTFEGDPTFDEDYGGSLVFDGSGDYIDFGNQSLIQTDFCISIWLQMTDSNDRYFFSAGYNNTNSILFYTQGIWLNSYQTDGRLPGNPDSTLNTIRNFTVTRTGSTASFYQNGVFKFSLSYSGNIATSVPYTLGWAVPRNKSTAYFKGNCYAFHMYDKGLTAEEVLQNYNATKDRFGL
jgi:hypothetical protein